MRVWWCVWLDIDIRTKAVAIKNMRSKRPMSFIIIGYLLAIRVLAVFALSFGNDIAVARAWHGDVHWVHG
jgi:hypothetical protein